MRKGIALLLLMVVCATWGNAFWIYAKARLAEGLIRHAWATTLEHEGGAVKPWSWADTWPVARLVFPKSKVDLLVLEGSAGNSLAFGPGRVIETGRPGEERATVLAGHRDTHFAFLHEMSAGDAFSVQTPRGDWVNYRVREALVVNSLDGDWGVPQQGGELHLITCYPFDAVVPGGPLRYVVVADESSLDAVNPSADPS